jgi:hypothetical protein
MKLWVIKQTENNSYDTYDSAVVAAETEDEAKRVKVGDNYSWCSPEHVTAEYIGEADDSVTAGVVLASFNAG